MLLYSVLATLVLLVIVITYFAYKTIKPKPSEEMANIAIHYDMNHELASDIKKTLDDYLQRPEAGEETFYKEVTVRMTRDNFESDYGRYLNPIPDELKKLSHADIERRCNEMECHFRELLQLQREVNLHVSRELVDK